MTPPDSVQTLPPLSVNDVAGGIAVPSGEALGESAASAVPVVRPVASAIEAVPAAASRTRRENGAGSGMRQLLEIRGEMDLRNRVRNKTAPPVRGRQEL